MVKTNEDLRWVLFEEWCSKIGPQSYDTQLKQLKNGIKFNERYKITLISKYLRKIHSLRNNQPNILFEHDFKYKNIIGKSSTKNPIILGMRHYSVPFILNRNIKFFPLYDIYTKLYRGIINNNENQLNNCLNELKKTLKDLNPNIIILNSDAVPTGRAITLVADDLDIPTVEIQHGIYQSTSTISTGKYANYVFVWGKYFKDLYLKNKVRSKEEVKILGYPYELKKGKYVNSKGKKKTIIYLGQNFESYNQKLINTKIKTITKLHKLCNGLGFKFEYRSHPGDNLKLLKSKLPYVKFTSSNETLENTIKKGDIFISFNSTSLIESALYSKLSIQLKNYDLPSDNFEKLGICPKSCDTIEELKIYLKDISKSNDISKFHVPVNEEYIKIPEPDPGTRFLELVEDIL